LNKVKRANFKNEKLCWVFKNHCAEVSNNQFFCRTCHDDKQLTGKRIVYLSHFVLASLIYECEVNVKEDDACEMILASLEQRILIILQTVEVVRDRYEGGTFNNYRAVDYFISDRR
jgi:hypothetical protein